MIKNLEKTFKALSDSNRIRILKMLEIRSLCLCEIQEVLGLAGATVSKHLSILRDAGFLASEKSGTWVFFSLAHPNPNVFATSLLRLLKKWPLDDETTRRDAKRVQSFSPEKGCR